MAALCYGTLWDKSAVWKDSTRVMVVREGIQLKVTVHKISAVAEMSSSRRMLLVQCWNKSRHKTTLEEEESQTVYKDESSFSKGS